MCAVGMCIGTAAFSVLCAAAPDGGTQPLTGLATCAAGGTLSGVANASGDPSPSSQEKAVRERRDRRSDAGTDRDPSENCPPLPPYAWA